MLTQVETAKQRWSGSHSAIDNWLSERQKLLVQYCELAGLPPFERDSSALPEKALIQSFCASLMDYMSAGHFEIYEKIHQQCANDSDTSDQLVETLFPQISATTDQALRFHDHYAEFEDDHALGQFDQKLSLLGQQLEERFSLEDQLLHSLHQSNS